MIELKQIRQDLRDIRYYYTKKELFDEMSGVVMPSTLLEKLARYNKAMEAAPARLFDLYVSLYVKGKTQAALAEERNYSCDYIKQLNLELCEYLRRTLSRT